MRAFGNAALTVSPFGMQRNHRLATALIPILALAAKSARAQEAGPTGTVEVGMTGFDVKRPVLASACENGCPWGELGDFLADAMKPLGYEVIQCRNCNQDKGPPIVSKGSHPPALGVADTFVGTTTRVDAPVDFGVTESGFLAWAHDGLYDYDNGSPFFTGTAGPFANLRLIARLEDPTYLLVAVKASSTVTDLAQIAQQQMAVTILGGGTPISQPVLDYYGLTQSAVTSWGGTFANAIVAGQETDPAFDVIVSELGSPANNPESEVWTKISQANALRFLDIPQAVIDKLANDQTLGLSRVTAKWGLLRGVDRAISTVGRSGEVVFGRDDTPEQAAYDTAKAIDQNRAALKWYIRPYSYDPRTVSQNFDVPLHPGAARYYAEMGYLPGGSQSCDGGNAAAPTASGGCGIGTTDPHSGRWAVLAAGAVLIRRRRGIRAPTPSCKPT
jgi:TRAP-type uncharacterized transport system substrate-binding protein